MKHMSRYCFFVALMAIAFLAARPAAATLIGPGGSGVVSPQDPVSFFAEIDRQTQGATFTHTFNFGFSVTGPATAQIVEIVDLLSLNGLLEGPSFAGVLPVTRATAVLFAAIDTGGTTPYVLTIMGRLLDPVPTGTYSGVVRLATVPEPAIEWLLLAAVAVLSALRWRAAR
jgi:hypothetical protein